MWSFRAWALMSKPGQITPPWKTPCSSTRSIVTAVPKSATTTASSTTSYAAAAATTRSVPTFPGSSSQTVIGSGISSPITWIFSPRSSWAIRRTRSVHTGLTLLTTMTPSRFFSFEVSRTGIFSPGIDQAISQLRLRPARNRADGILLAVEKEPDADVRISDVYRDDVHISLFLLYFSHIRNLPTTLRIGSVNYQPQEDSRLSTCRGMTAVHEGYVHAAADGDTYGTLERDSRPDETHRQPGHVLPSLREAQLSHPVAHYRRWRTLYLNACWRGSSTVPDHAAAAFSGLDLLPEQLR